MRSKGTSPDPVAVPQGHARRCRGSTVVTQKGAVGVYAPIRFDGAEPQLFIVDTGAEISMVAPLTHRAHFIW